MKNNNEAGEQIKYLFNIEERRSIPEFDRFASEMDNLIVIGQPSSFWRCKASFSKLLNSDFMMTLINQELLKTTQDPFYIPSGGGSEIDLAAVLSNKYNLFVKVLEPGMVLSDRLYGNTQHTMVGVFYFQDSGSVEIDFFEQPSPFPNEVMDPAKPLKPIGKKILYPSEILEIRAAHDVFRMSVVNRPVVVAILSSENIYPLRWEYDTRTYAPIRAIAASPNSSRLVYTIQMLSEIGNEDSIAALRALLAHDDHFVRWAAMKSIFELDDAEGTRVLEAGTMDSHPHIRSAAINSLKHIHHQNN